MATREFMLQRICVFAGKDINPDDDADVIEMLKVKFNIMLPQRPSLNDALASSTSDHDIVELLINYRSMK